MQDSKADFFFFFFWTEVSQGSAGDQRCCRVHTPTPTLWLCHLTYLAILGFLKNSDKKP